MSTKDMAKQAHYEALSPQPIDVIRAWKLDFNLGNVIKYIGRCRTKGQELEDLEKAKVYLQWRIDELKADAKPVVPDQKSISEALEDWAKEQEQRHKPLFNLWPPGGIVYR